MFHSGDLNWRSKIHIHLLMIWTCIILCVETALPFLTLSFAILLLFIACVWADLWSHLSPFLKIISNIIFIISFCLPLIYLGKTFQINRSKILNRLDHEAKNHVVSLSALFDRNLIGTHEDSAHILWQIHQNRLRAQLDSYPLPRLASNLSLHDPYALRLLCLLIFIACGFIAGAEKISRLQSALSWPLGQNQILTRIDVWIDPPSYTHRPPLIIDTSLSHSLTVPVHSTLIAHSSDEAELTLQSDETIPQDNIQFDKQSHELRAQIDRDGTLTLYANGQKLNSLHILIIPDHLPRIHFTDRLTQTEAGKLDVSYNIDDDYGIIQALAHFSSPRVSGLKHEGRILIPPPEVNLELPAQNGRGDAHTNIDITAHPWAGVYADLQLSAKDEAQNEGVSEKRFIHIPERHFTKSLPRILIEQRRLIAFSADDTRQSSEALSALMLDPDIFNIDASNYLNLRHIISSLHHAQNDQDLLDVVDFMWAMAVDLEDGALNDAEKALRDAENDLEQALKNNSDQDRLEELMNHYSKALQTYLSELDHHQDQNATQSQNQSASRVITTEDLAQLIRDMNEKAQKGDLIGALNELQQLQNIMHHLQAGSAQKDSRQRQAEQSMGELDHLMREQQMLHDQTYDQFSSSDKNKKSQSDNQDQSRLAHEQDQLAQKLNQLLNKLDELDPSDHSHLSHAEEAMKEAGRSLSSSSNGKEKALEAQTNAIEQLQQGLQDLANNLMNKNNSDGAEQSAGDQNGQQGNPKTDPLGRQNAQNGRQHSPFDLPGASAAQRAQSILQELRSRLSSPTRPNDELNYLERLLKTY